LRGRRRLDAEALAGEEPAPVSRLSHRRPKNNSKQLIIRSFPVTLSQVTIPAPRRRTAGNDLRAVPPPSVPFRLRAVPYTCRK